MYSKRTSLTSNFVHKTFWMPNPHPRRNKLLQIALRITRRYRDMVKKLPMKTGRLEIALNGLLLFEIMLKKVNLLLILLLIRETEKSKAGSIPSLPLLF